MPYYSYQGKLTLEKYGQRKMRRISEVLYNRGVVVSGFGQEVTWDVDNRPSQRAAEAGIPSHPFAQRQIPRLGIHEPRGSQGRRIAGHTVSQAAGASQLS